MIDASEIDFGGELSSAEARELADALNEALDSMALSGSNIEPMQAIAALHLVALREVARQYALEKMLRAPAQSGAD
jgi:hypothetical protein